MPGVNVVSLGFLMSDLSKFSLRSALTLRKRLFKKKTLMRKTFMSVSFAIMQFSLHNNISLPYPFARQIPQHRSCHCHIPPRLRLLPSAASIPLAFGTGYWR